MGISCLKTTLSSRYVKGRRPNREFQGMCLHVGHTTCVSSDARYRLATSALSAVRSRAENVLQSGATVEIAPSSQMYKSARS